MNKNNPALISQKSRQIKNKNKFQVSVNWLDKLSWLVIIPLFFVSGMTGLIYEVTWTRMFTTVFGNTTYAVSAVLTAFMGGLALGSYVIGHFIDRKQQILKIAALLELGVGIAALLMPLVLVSLNPLYAKIYRVFPDVIWLLMVVKTILAFFILLIPTFLMGGTLPVLSKFFIRHLEQSSSRVAVLYAVNTLGATIGCAITGFVLLETLGVSATIHYTALLNFTLAISFYILGILLPTGPADPIPAEKKDGSDRTTSTLKYSRLVLILYSIAGFVSLSYEVLWFRLLVFKLNTTVYAFTIMLTVFLAGIGLGSLFHSVLEKTGLIKRHFKTFGIIELLIGLFGLFSIILFGNFESLTGFVQAVTWGELTKQQILISALIMLIPTVLMGIAFPVVNRIHADYLHGIGTSVGRVYSANTFGTILGSFLTGFVLVEWIGTQWSLILISLVGLLAGSSILLMRPAELSESRISKHMTSFFMTICWIGALIIFLTVPRDLLFQYYNIGEKRINNRAEIIYANEGVECITTVHRYPDGNRVISTGSINVAGTDFTLRTTQKLQAHIPMLLHPNAKTVLQIGFGSGETSYLLTTYPTERVDVVDISRGVFETSAEYFTDLNRGVMNDPKFRAIVMDGANYVAVTDRKYDVIMNDSIWPFYSGNSGLYTYEYFLAGRDHLRPGGIMTSWLPVDMPEESLKSLLRTFQSVFPHVSLWMAVTHFNKHGLLVGSLEPLKIDVELFLQRFEQFAETDLKIIHLDNPLSFLDAFKMDENGFQKWVELAPLHTVDSPVLEFAPRKRHPGEDLIRAYEWILYAQTDLENQLINIPQAGFSLDTLKSFQKATKHVMLGLVKREKGEEGYLPELKRALQEAPYHPGAHYLLDEVERLQNTGLSTLNLVDFNGLLELGETFLENDMLDKAKLAYDRANQLNPNSAIVHYNLGVLYYRQGLLNHALSELNQALELKPDYSPAFNIRGLLFYALKNPSAAISDFDRALQLNPDDAQAVNNRGIVLASQKNYQAALFDFNRAIALNPIYAQAFYNRGVAYQFGFQDLGISEEIAVSKALSDYTAAILFDPDYSNAYNNRGMGYARKGDYAAAIRDFGQVIVLNPDQADAYYNRGLAFQLSGNERQADIDFKKAIALDPSYQKIFSR